MELETVGPLAMIGNPSFTSLLPWIFVVAVVIFIVHAIVVSYHWYTFGSDRPLSILAITIYGGVGGLLLLAMGLALFTL